MTGTRVIKALMDDGFDRKFAEEAVEWFATLPASFRKAVKTVPYIKDNEYLIRNP